MDLIPGLTRSHGGGNGKPLQYSCLENPMDRGGWQAVVCVYGECDVIPRMHVMLSIQWV